MFLPVLLATFFLLGSLEGYPQTKDKRLAQANNDLAFDLLRYYKDQQNVFFSPFSISSALGMVYLGSNGTTAEAMRRTLKYDQYGLSEQEVSEAFKVLQNHLKNNAGGYELSSVNNLLVQDYFIILHMYGHALQQYYSAEIESVDFAKNGASIQNRVNSLVDSATHGKIRNFLSSPPDPATKLLILNAVYFIGNWLSPFSVEATRDAPFYNNGLVEKNVSTMIHDTIYEHFVSDELNATMVVLPYQGNNSASMIILLPNERTGVAALAEKLNQNVMDGLLSSSYRRRLMFTFPKYNVSYSPDLVSALKHLGLSELFADSADLSRMSSLSLKVSSIQHKAVLVVNEKGSEAAAATGIQIVPTSLPPVVRVNSPFLYFIRDQDTGMILFAGKVDEL